MPPSPAGVQEQAQVSGAQYTGSRSNRMARLKHLCPGQARPAFVCPRWARQEHQKWQRGIRNGNLHVSLRGGASLPHKHRRRTRIGRARNRRRSARAAAETAALPMAGMPSLRSFPEPPQCATAAPPGPAVTDFLSSHMDNTRHNGHRTLSIGMVTKPITRSYLRPQLLTHY
jgi:hypothetical protein